MAANPAGLTSQIVAAYVRKNYLTPADLPGLIGSVNASVTGAGAPEPEAKAVPMVSARASVRPEAIRCMTCGRAFKSIRRHLSAEHGQTPNEYRAQWNLPRDYPMVSANYSAQRSALATAIGLGASKRRTAPLKGGAAAKAPSATQAAPAAPAAKSARAKSAAARSAAKLGHPKPSSTRKGRAKKVTPESLGETGKARPPEPMF